MTSKPPPVPEENRSPKGPGDAAKPAEKQEVQHANATDNPDKRGQTGNTKLNTTHQGYQQDR
ncbi:hypothetical protein [Phyllobacterium endophyticum]|jgi:hypothetical protein|uniref:Uncharacterized protein n=1 Tax=Phyllobacterium endophyticum TaxID=1149773 RepID=A0A2P7B029_9HYPH|nr:hypothetical protein [Phyllobacterium endophyticum]MBB3235543.1 hypothetical protein [Phyllobacterium endophyticum]PSH59820.1 hypothetical protein CU100_03410 [Phyllobacterium endophyticum]TXR47966.1 hypothetical protein FVA77_16820 [Phyllobacterium endophyticum]TYR41969.1 hypothetical protein FY050_12020 [Phyllobacterium endophyticum]